MKKYILLTFGLAMCLSQTIQAQVDGRDQWMNKYWYYRWRLINNFMVVGEGRGKSIPAEIRSGQPTTPTDGGGSGFWTWGQGGITPSETVLEFGADGTSYLGEYIAVLASEYRFVKLRAVPTDPSGGHCLDETGMELKYALEAVERLDDSAETYMNRILELSDVGSQPNGFLMRDDVPTDFIDENGNTDGNTEGYSNYLKLNTGITTSHIYPYEYSKVNRVHGKLTDALSGHDAYYLCPSKDQYAHLFEGLAMVANFCADGDNYEGYLFKENAQRILQNMINYLTSEGNDYGQGKCPTGISGYGANGHSTENATGTDNLLGEGFFFTAKNWAGIVPPSPSDGSKSAWDGNDAWIDVQIDAAPGDCYSNAVQNLYMSAMLGAVGDAFLPPLTFTPLIYVGSNQYTNYNDQRLTDMARTWDSYKLYPLMHTAMFGWPIEFEPGDYSGLLNSAPCYGPYNFGPQGFSLTGPGDAFYIDYCNESTHMYFDNGYSSYDWSSRNRWFHYADNGVRENVCNDADIANCSQVNYDYCGHTCSGGSTAGYLQYNPVRQGGEFNGLDYMLLYNMYMTVWGWDGTTGGQDPISGFKNEITNYLDETWPSTFGGTIIGNSANLKKNIGFKSIYSTEHVTSTGNVEEQAGEEIDLNPGFAADAGSSYYAFVEPLSDCVSGGNTYQSPPPPKKTNAITSSIPNPGETATPKLYNATPIVSANLNIVDIYPNPFSNDLNIDVETENNSTFNLSVINMLGQVIDQRTITNNNESNKVTVTLDYYKLSNGFYTVTVTNGKSISQKKIIKD